MSQPTATGQVHKVYIRASPQAIWDAITQAEWTVQYGYQAPVDYGDLRPGAAYRGLASEAMRVTARGDLVLLLRRSTPEVAAGG